MKMTEKLAKQQQLGRLLLFKEGLFLKAYNESAYLLIELLGLNLKVKCYPMKCLNNNWVVEVAFPANKLTVHLPKAVITAFGAQLEGEYDLSVYEPWYMRRWLEANEVRREPKAEERPLQTVSPSAPSLLNDTVNKTSVLLPLTAQQLFFLLSWQKTSHPIDIDRDFIAQLKQKVIQITESK